MSGEHQVKIKITLLSIGAGQVVYRSRLGEVQVTVRRASNLKSSELDVVGRET